MPDAGPETPLPSSKCLTLDGLANALRGMPRSAPVLVRLSSGELRPVALVRPIYILTSGTEALSAGSAQGQYVITLEVAGA